MDEPKNCRNLSTHSTARCGIGIENRRNYKNISGRKKGILTAIDPTEKRDGTEHVLKRLKREEHDRTIPVDFEEYINAAIIIIVFV